jgi:hypothetical protein
MHDLTFSTLDGDSLEDLLVDLTSALGGLRFSSDTITVTMAEIPFYEEYALYAVRDNTSAPPNVRYLLRKPGDAVLLDWTNVPIYTVNERAPVRIEDDTIISYVKFFLHFVRGTIGSFFIVEKPGDVAWRPEAPQDQIAAVNDRLIPMRNEGIDKDNLYSVKASVVFGNALFYTDIKIAPFELEAFNRKDRVMENYSLGQMSFQNEELLIEDLLVIINPFPEEAIRDL